MTSGIESVLEIVQSDDDTSHKWFVWGFAWGQGEGGLSRSLPVISLSNEKHTPRRFQPTRQKSPPISAHFMHAWQGQLVRASAFSRGRAVLLQAMWERLPGPLMVLSERGTLMVWNSRYVEPSWCRTLKVWNFHDALVMWNCYGLSALWFGFLPICGSFFSCWVSAGPHAGGKQTWPGESPLSPGCLGRRLWWWHLVKISSCFYRHQTL